MIADGPTQPHAASEDRPQPARPVAQGDTSPTSDTMGGSEPLSGRGSDLGFAGMLEAPAADSLIGVEMGGIRIEAIIAEGGMGRVYRATQHEPRRTVAVKVMRPIASRLAIARFQREVAVLARLRHPAIAQVYLAGTQRVGGDEVRYFVMELVPEAKTIIAFATTHHLSEQERCGLFLQVCEAVAHGHAHGVIHRDIKPGNVLVDAAGHVKVIDFGVARLIDAEGGGYTETGELVGTRHAMSPEQFATDGRVADARSDVYSLGVLLHQLLTGRLPYDIDETSLVATARIVQETVPRRLTVANRELRGLSVVADRCLAKQPDDRYASAADLAADVRRVMAGAMPLALSQSFRAKAGWWIQRHRAAVAIATIVAIGLVSVIMTVPLGNGRPMRGAGSPPTSPPPADGDRSGPSGRFVNVSSGRTTALDWVALEFDEDVSGLSLDGFRLVRDGRDVPLQGVGLTGGGRQWKLTGMSSCTAEAGKYVLSLSSTESGPRDAAGNRLENPAQITWRMPPRRTFAFDLLGEEWEQHVVSLEGVERYTERHAGATTFIRPTEVGVEGRAVLRFRVPFDIQDAALKAGVSVWTTGDPFPYDPGAQAAIDVSPDGESWTTITALEAGRGGHDLTLRDVSQTVAGGREVWVRARLKATREWPGDGLIFAQFLRTDPNNPIQAFQLDLVGPHPPVIPAGND